MLLSHLHYCCILVVVVVVRFVCCCFLTLSIKLILNLVFILNIFWTSLHKQKNTNDPQSLTRIINSPHGSYRCDSHIWTIEILQRRKKGYFLHHSKTIYCLAPHGHTKTNLQTFTAQLLASPSAWDTGGWTAAEGRPSVAKNDQNTEKFEHLHVIISC